MLGRTGHEVENDAFGSIRTSRIILDDIGRIWQRYEDNLAGILMI